MAHRVFRLAIFAATTLLGLTPALADEPAKITLTLSDPQAPKDLNPLFLGLSYEMRSLLPQPDNTYYFDPADENLLRIYHTLGITSLRVGANAVDDPKVPVPDTQEIDHLFTFAKKAGLKVIYSLRLKNGDPATAARLAKYIDDHYRDTLDCYSIGNEPDFYLKTYDAFREKWRPIYDAILKAVPNAQFDGPATSRKSYSLEFADEFFPLGHLKMVSTHTYALGNGRAAEKDPPAARDRFVSNKTLAGYQRLYDGIVKPLADKHVPYRLDETNSCFGGGAKDISDSYASTLWILDYLNWWAQHDIQGLNFHTGDTVNGIPPMPSHYAIFVHNPDAKTFDVRPAAYGLLAFSQVAHGHPIPLKLDGADGLDFTAYAYRDATHTYLALLNKTHADHAQTLTLSLPGLSPLEQLDLHQKDADLAAKSEIELGPSPIDPTGAWSGKWEPASAAIQLKPLTALLLRTATP